MDLGNAVSVRMRVNEGPWENSAVVDAERGAVQRPALDMDAPAGTVYYVEYEVEWGDGKIESVPAAGPHEFRLVDYGELDAAHSSPPAPRMVRYAWA